MAVDTLGYLLALHVTPANEQNRSQVGKLVQAVQEETSSSVKIAFVDQGYTGDTAANEASEHDVDLCVVKLPEAKRGFVLLPRRWVVERSFGWVARFRRLARDYEKLPLGAPLIITPCKRCGSKPSKMPSHSRVALLIERLVRAPLILGTITFSCSLVKKI